MNEVDVTLTMSELEAVIKAVQIGKNKVGSLLRKQSAGAKKEALKREYGDLASAEAELSDAFDQALIEAA